MIRDENGMLNPKAVHRRCTCGKRSQPHGAVSKVGARIVAVHAETAERYGLVVNDARDDRTDVFRSTRAAARYLHGLYRTFGKW